jgi:hypothetical protein
MTFLRNIRQKLGSLTAPLEPFSVFLTSLGALLFFWYALALVGLFFIPLVALSFSLWILFLGFYFFFLHNPKNLLRSWPVFVFLLLSLCIASIALVTHPIELSSGGRDQGSFIHSALLLIQHHGFVFSLPEAKPFFDLYGTGKALHFPGFSYLPSGSLTPEFPLLYIVWLASLVGVFGVFGFSIANGVLFVLSGLLLFSLLRSHFSSFFAGAVVLLFQISFLPLWFVSFTLSENLSLTLFLSTLYFLERALRGSLSPLFPLASALLLALTRIEGWAILIITASLLWFFSLQRPALKTLFVARKNTFLFGVAFLTVLTTFFVNLPYYKSIAKALLKNLPSGSANASSFFTDTLELYRVLLAYNVLPFLLLGIISTFFFLLSWWQGRKSNQALPLVLPLLPIFLALPALPYLLFPHITPDAPWMLRRFLPFVFPALFLVFWYAVAALSTRAPFASRKLWYTLSFFALLALTLPTLLVYKNTSPERTLLGQVELLSTFFTEKDLLLIDKDLSGDNFMMPTTLLGSLYHRPSVYFFNPNDLDRLDTKNYDRVFLLTPEKKVVWYQSGTVKKLSFWKSFTFVNTGSFRVPLHTKRLLPTPTVIITRASILEVQ